MVHIQWPDGSGHRRATRHPLPERYRLARSWQQTILLCGAARQSTIKYRSCGENLVKIGLVRPEMALLRCLITVLLRGRGEICRLRLHRLPTWYTGYCPPLTV